MERKVLTAKLDVIFKKLFSDKNNEDLLRHFLSCILEIPYDNIQKIYILNPEILPGTVDGKFGRMDLKLLVDDRLINVEMQVNNQIFFNDRSLFYWSKMYSDQLKSSEQYDQLKKTIAVNILDFNMFTCKEFHSHFKIMETSRHNVLTDKFSMHFFELKKISKEINKDDPMELWLQFINAENEEEYAMLQNTGVEPIKKAVTVIHEMSADEKTRELAWFREKALHDEAALLYESKQEGIEEGRKEGREEGRKEGIEKGRSEMIEKMRRAGFSDEEIKRISNL